MPQLLMTQGELCESQGACFEGDWGVFVLIQCFLCLVASLINASMFRTVWILSREAVFTV